MLAIITEAISLGNPSDEMFGLKPQRERFRITYDIVQMSNSK